MDGQAKATSNRRQTEREMPRSHDAEQAVLGAMLLDQAAVAVCIEVLVTSRRFYSPAHQKIYDAIARLFERAQPADITTVAEELEKTHDLDTAGGRTYLTELANSVATAANAQFYANIVFEKALLRELITASTEIVSECYRQEDAVDALLDNAEQKIFSIAEDRLKSEFTVIKKLLPQTFEAIEEFRDSKGGLIGYPTGFRELDDITIGLHKGDLIIIAGRPSMGKSALAMNIAENLCMETNKAAAFFSLEMSKEQMALRMVCGKARISTHKIRADRISEEDWARLARASGPLSEAEIYIDDTPAMSVLQMRAKARRLAAQTDLGLVVIDYMQMMSGSRYAENRQQEIAQISRGLKGLAKELKIPVIACSQLSRMVETRGGEKRPQLSDLRESGAIEQDADVVMFVYRPEYYLSGLHPDDPKLMEVKGRAEIIVAKQRNGPTGTIRLSFLSEYARFENLATGFVPQPPMGTPDQEAPF